MTRTIETSFLRPARWPALGVLLATTLRLGAAAPDRDQQQQFAFFDAKVHPILEAHCFKCHGGEEKLKGGLRLTSREGLLQGGDLGPVYDAANPDRSLLLRMISYQDERHQMPPKGKLPPAAIAALTEWIRRGAPYNPAREIKGHAEAKTHDNEVNERTKNYWAFRPLTRPAVPAVADAAWRGNPIDAFILARLAGAGLRPNPPAPRQQLIRRVHYDLTGLPPTPAEVTAFERDASPKAFEKVIDDLLARPQYGEKWGRHWLDLVRYAESNGYERDGRKPYVWRYRDYVIKSFNDDKPYDRFLIEQLAGDELETFSPEAYIATGYYRLGLWDDEPVDPVQAYYDGLDDILATTGQAMLGLTIGCARCHDHKIDPIPQRDYYGLMAFLGNIRHYGNRSHQTVIDASVRPVLPPARADVAHEESKELEGRRQKLERELKSVEKLAHENLVAGEKDDFRHEQNRVSILGKYVGQWISRKRLDDYVAGFKEFQELQGRLKQGAEPALVVTEKDATADPMHVMIRGNPHAPGPAVRPAFLSVLSPPPPRLSPAPGGRSSGQRSALARWIASPDNPLTARVFMNRVWQHHFGRGIVRSSDNFGRLGDQPTHPELLNWLAAEFVSGGWQLKRLHKQIMLSRAYQMSSAGADAALARDPANDFFWRFNPRRLTAEEVRDSAINLTGRLNLKMGGESIFTEVPREVLATASRPDAAWGNSPEAERNRRSVYIHVKRSLHEPVLKAFDMADTDGHCSVRFASVLPTQSLTMMNSKFFNDIATGFAERVRGEAGADARAQAGLALSLAFNRAATAAEIQRGVEFMSAVKSPSGADPLQRFCLLVLNLNEFMFVD